MDEKQLLDLKKEIEKAREELAELQGSVKHLYKQLKEDWNCTSLDQAQTKLKEFEKQHQETKETIQTLSEELDQLLEE